MPRKKSARNAEETPELEDPADILATAQQRMGILQRSRNRRRRAVANRHAEEFDKVKKRIDARLDADRRRITEAQKEALRRHFDAVASVLHIEKKIEGKIRETHRQCGRFIKLLSLVYDGRAEEALQVEIEKLEHRVSGGSEE